MEIRRMNRKDYAAYCALLTEVHMLHAQNRADIFRSEPVFPDETEFAEMIADEQAVCLAADMDGQMAGMCLMEIRMPKAAHVHYRAFGWIGDLCVRSDLRGRGIGTMLYRAMKDEARRLNLARVELMVWAFNEEARGFYEKLGMNVRSYTMEDRL